MAMPMIFMGVLAGGGGGSKSGKLFSADDEGGVWDDARICINFIFFLKFCCPSPHLYDNSKIPMGNSCECWWVGVGANPKTFIFGAPVNV
jgi:hypothetical protein